MEVKRATLVLSQSCSVFLRVVSLRLMIISLIVSFKAAISPCASSAIDRVRSPLVTAVATSASGRTLGVGLGGGALTVFVRSRAEPAAAGHRGWAPGAP